MTVNSNAGICNLALAHLGNNSSVNSIDVPVSKIEVAFALWFDTARQHAIKLAMPNFAMARRTVAQLTTAPAFGWGYAYQYPPDCLKLLGIGEVKCKENNYAVEGNQILTDWNCESGLNIRFLIDVTDINKWSPEFVIFFSYVLAMYTAMPITQDANKKKELEQLVPMKLAELSGLNAQENRPIRKHNSRFLQARYSNWPDFQVKK